MGGCDGNVGLCGCVWGVYGGGTFGFWVSCVVYVLVVASGEGPGKGPPPALVDV